MSSSRKIIYREIADVVWKETDSSTVYVLWLEVGEEVGDFPDMLSAVEWIREYRNLSIAVPVRLPVFLVYSNSQEFMSELVFELGAVVLEKDTQGTKELKKWVSGLSEVKLPDGDWLDSYVLRDIIPHKDDIHFAEDCWNWYYENL